MLTVKPLFLGTEVHALQQGSLLLMVTMAIADLFLFLFAHA